MYSSDLLLEVAKKYPNFNTIPPVGSRPVFIEGGSTLLQPPITAQEIVLCSITPETRELLILHSYGVQVVFRVPDTGLGFRYQEMPAIALARTAGWFIRAGGGQEFAQTTTFGDGIEQGLICYFDILAYGKGAQPLIIESRSKTELVLNIFDPISGGVIFPDDGTRFVGFMSGYLIKN